MWYICNGILLIHKKELNIAIYSNMDGPRGYHTKWSKSDRERQILYNITYMNLFTKQKQTHRLREWTYGYWGEGWRGGMDWEFGIDMYTPLYLK